MTFNASMVTLARESAGLTQGLLAQNAGVSQALISKIEHGLETPSGELIERFALACDVPTDFFHRSDPVLGESITDLFHKKRKTLPAKPLRRANALANMVRLEALRLLGSLDFDFDPMPVFSSDRVGPSEAAQMLRAFWRIPAGPLPDLVSLIEAAATPVFSMDLGHEKLFALSMPGVDGSKHVIVLNSALPPSAQRFALAHEIGHLVMHNKKSAPGMEMEEEAQQFASALLMPEHDVRPELERLRFKDLGGLKNRWRVSLAALIRRAHTLGTISDRQYRTFNIQLSGLPGGRKKEPGEWEPENPRFMKYVLDHYRTEKGYTLEEIRKVMVITEGSFDERYGGGRRSPLHSVGGEARGQLRLL
jgi:Zn-dependent peptidase ImmA (M78 family)/DNA-binding XRE family transcriptional regulator